MFRKPSRLVPCFIVGAFLALAGTFLLVSDAVAAAQEPEANVDSITIDEDTSVAINVLANDSSSNGSLFVQLDTLETFQGGTLSFNPDLNSNPEQKITYTPRPNWVGTDFFFYRVVNPEDEFSLSYAIINVNNVNDAPVISPIAEAARVVDEDELMTFNVNVTDPDIGTVIGEKITYTLSGDIPAGARLDPNTGIFTWIPRDPQTNFDYYLIVTVTDNGTPALSRSMGFVVRGNFLYADETTPQVGLRILPDTLPLPPNTIRTFSTPVPGVAPLQNISLTDPAANPLSGIMKVDAYAFDNNELAEVIFYVDERPLLSSDRGGTLTWDTRKETNGFHVLRLAAADRAINITDMSVLVQVQNTDSAGHVIPHPANESFRIDDSSVELYAEFTGADVDTLRLYENGLQNALRVSYIKNGQTNPLQGNVIYDGDGRLRFNGAIPDNCVVEWVVNVPDTAGAYMGGIYWFTQPMRRSIGGTVKSSDGRLSISIPPDALVGNHSVFIKSAQDTGALSHAIDNSNVDLVAGPYEVYAIDQNGNKYTLLEKPAALTFQDFISGENAGFARQIQDCSGSECQALEGFDAKKSQSTTINFTINKLSTFRIIQFLITGSGLTDLYNFPNPFNPAQGNTKFRYLLNEDSHVDIVIYDLFGNLVRKLAAQSADVGGRSGENFFPWDGKNGNGEEVANGGYIAKISAKGISGHESKVTRKVLVVK